MTQRVAAVVFDVSAKSWLFRAHNVAVEAGQTLLVGREGDLPVAVKPPDSGVSRRALQVTWTAQGWVIDVLNANHAWLYPWAQRPVWAAVDSTVRKRWPRIGIHLVGTDDRLQHWILLESDQWIDGRPERPSGTDIRGAPTELTGPQMNAIYAVFPDHLAWPPVAGAIPRPLKSAARRLGITQTAVTQRLEQARARSKFLGHQQVGVTEPEYVYLLAEAGLLPLPAVREPEAGCSVRSGPTGV